MPQSPNSLLDQVISTKKSAEVDLAEIPNATRAGFAMRQQQALEELPRLMDKLQKEVVPTRLVAIVAYGNEAATKAAADFLTANGGIVLDAGKFYRDIALKIEPTYSTDRLFRTNQHMGVVLKCEQASKALGLGNNVDVNYHEAYCKDFDASVAHCRKSVRSSVGDTLNAALLARAAVNAVVAGKLDDARIPVLIVGSTEDELPALRGLCLRSVAHTFEEGAVADKDAILAIIKTAT